MEAAGVNNCLLSRSDCLLVPVLLTKISSAFVLLTTWHIDYFKAYAYCIVFCVKVAVGCLRPYRVPLADRFLVTR